jgi:hypothetical protein
MSFFSGLKNTGCIFLLFILFVPSQMAKASDEHGFNKGSFYFFWGYNRGYFSRSDIHFSGNNYAFTLHDVKANDRQSKLGVDPYLEVSQMTIPQYNYRLGYCINKHFNISVGFDHMKYVMNQYQTVTMDGYIHQSGTTYDGDYDHKKMVMNDNFLQFEHTDGLNYIDAELTRMDNIMKLGKHIGLNSMAGFGAGALYPRTRVLLLNRNVNDEWHFSGYGLSCHIGLNITVFKHLFLQSTAKGGYINMPNIVTTGKAEDRAHQHFFFMQTNIVLGYRFLIH